MPRRFTLGQYEAAGMGHAHATLAEADAALIADRTKARLADAAGQENPALRQIMLAQRRADLHDLDERARAVRQAVGDRVQTECGERIFAAGDRVCCLRNECEPGMENGTRGLAPRISRK